MKSDNENLFDAYIHADSREVVEEWGKPANRLMQGVKGFMAGKSGIPGSGLVGGVMKAIAPNTTNRMTGGWEMGEETNRLWDLFNKQILSHPGTPTGQDVFDWFTGPQAKFDGVKNGSVAGIKRKPGDPPYDENSLQTLFKNAVADQQKIWAGLRGAAPAGAQGAAPAGSDQQDYVTQMANLTPEERREFLQIIVQLNLITIVEITSTSPLDDAPPPAAAPAAPAAPGAAKPAAAPAAPAAPQAINIHNYNTAAAGGGGGGGGPGGGGGGGGAGTGTPPPGGPDTVSPKEPSK